VIILGRYGTRIKIFTVGFFTADILFSETLLRSDLTGLQVLDGAGGDVGADSPRPLSALEGF